MYIQGQCCPTWLHYQDGNRLSCTEVSFASNLHTEGLLDLTREPLSSPCFLGTAGDHGVKRQAQQSAPVRHKPCVELWMTKQQDRQWRRSLSMKSLNEQSQTPRHSFRQNAHIQGAGQNSGAEEDYPGWKQWLQMALNNAICSVPAVPMYDTRRHLTWNGSQDPVSVQPTEARQGGKWS